MRLAQVQLATQGRPGGFSGYWRQLEFELRDGLVPIDAVDASALRPGTHEVEVHSVQHTRTGSRVVFKGKAGRRHTHEFSREEWSDFGAELGSLCRVAIVRSAGAVLHRTLSGLIAALGSRGEIAGVFPTVEAARASVAVSELVLAEAEVIR